MIRGLLAGAVLLADLVVGSGTAAADEPQRCAEFRTDGYCVEWAGGSSTSHPAAHGGPRPRPAGEVVCYWRTIDQIPPMAVSGGQLPGVPSGVPLVWQERVCSDGSQGDDPLVNVRWAPAPETVAPENLAATARARLSRLLPPPELVTSPPVGVAAIVGVPAFVAVSNWAGEVSESECAAGLCVTVTATPALTFTPGELGSTTVDCRGHGTRHRPGADPHREVAVLGACAHVFTRRTGVGGRPSEWPGSVSVTWTIEWTSSTGATASLPSVSRSLDLPRAVEEVQAPVVGGELP
jgi:hypothetical protein